MKVSQLIINNFRGIKSAKLDFNDHVLLVGRNNVGKSTICEALELALSPDRQNRFPIVEEYDFYNARYLDDDANPVPITIEVLLTDVTSTVEKSCWNNLERWDPTKRRILGEGELDGIDTAGFQWCLRLLTIARYNIEEDEFQAASYFAKAFDPEDENANKVSRIIRRSFGFLYLRALRTGSRALSLERGSLLDNILRIQSLRTDIWENVRNRLEQLDPPIEEGATELGPVLRTIEKRLAEYIPIDKPGEATKLFISQLTREHLRKTLSFFVSVTADQKPVPFQDVGTGTLNTLVLALLSFIAELKEENVIFAMEEPEIALPPHTQRRIVNHLLQNTTQCFVTSHSPYIIERFEPEQIMVLRRDAGTVTGKSLSLISSVKAKTYRRHLRRGFAEAMLGKAVIVAEGITEQLALHAAAQKMEEADENKYPLDLIGVTIFCADGDGSMAEFGRFFVSLDLPTFGFLDQKTRSATEQAALDKAGYEIVNETPYTTMERLLATEVPIDHQWAYLDMLRESGVAPNAGIPAVRPTDEDTVRGHTRKVLKDGKGWGRAADLIDLCSVEELPPSITGFLDQLYTRFPRPVVPDTEKDDHTDSPDEPAATDGGGADQATEQESEDGGTDVGS